MWRRARLALNPMNSGPSTMISKEAHPFGRPDETCGGDCVHSFYRLFRRRLLALGVTPTM
jgi:hypothetical protein